MDKPRRKTRQSLWHLAQYPLIAAVALGASANATFGQSVVAVYALAAILVKSITSRVTFLLALVILVSVPLFEFIGQSGIAENAAIYVYELLVIGTIQAIIELRHTDSERAAL